MAHPAVGAGASPSAVCIIISNVFLLVGEQRRSSTAAAVPASHSRLGSDTARCQRIGAAMIMTLSQLPCGLGEDNLAVPASLSWQTTVCSAVQLPVPYATRSCVMCSGF